MRRIGLLLVVSTVLWLVACGSSSSGGGGSSTITSVTVSCSPSTILYGQTSQCSATVMGTGTFSSGVTCGEPGERRHDLDFGLVHRTIRRSHVAAGHDYGNLDPGHQQIGDGHGDGESGATE